MIYVVAAVVIAMLALVAYLVHAVLDAVKDQNAARDLYEKQREATDEVTEARDAALVELARAKADLDDAKARLAASTAENERLIAQQKAVLGKEIDDAKGDDLVALSHSVLGPHVPGAGATTTADHPAEAPAVPGSGRTGGS